MSASTSRTIDLFLGVAPNGKESLEKFEQSKTAGSES